MTDIPTILLTNSTHSEDCAGLDHVKRCNDTERADMFPLSADRANQTYNNKTFDKSGQYSSLTESTHKCYDAEYHREVYTKRCVGKHLSVCR